MLSRSVLWVAGLLAATVAQAQNPTTDSLRSVLDTARTDSVVVWTRLGLCLEYRYAGDTTYLGFIDTTITLAGKAGLYPAQARGIFERGQFMELRGRTGEALTEFRRGEALAREHGLQREQGYALFFLAGVHRYRAEHEEALATYGRALAVFEALDMVPQQATIRFSQGVMLDHLGRFDESIRHFYQALSVYEELDDPYGIGLTCSSLGIMHGRIGKHREALALYRRGLPYMERAGNRLEKASILANMGGAFRALGQMDSASYHIKASLVEREAVGDGHGLAVGLMQYSEYQERDGDLPGALISLQRAASLFRSIGNRQYHSQTLARWAQLLMKNGRAAEARAKADSALLLARETHSMNEVLAAHRILAELHEVLGEPRPALEHLKAHAAVKDSLLNRENMEALDELRTRYETEKKDRLLAEQELRLAQGQAALEQRNKVLWGTGVGAGALAVIALLLWRDRRRGAKLAEARIQRVESEQKAASARALLQGEEHERQRVARELHDGIGVLLSSALMHQQEGASANGTGRSQELLEEACTEVRRISHALMPGSLARFGLQEALEELARNTTLRSGLQVHVQTFGLKDRLPEAQETALFRIAQEALNNTLKYADARTFNIDISREDDQLHVLLSDDGRGFDVQQHADGNGLGNIRSRSLLLMGNATLRSAPGEGTAWEVTLPLNDVS